MHIVSSESELVESKIFRLSEECRRDSLPGRDLSLHFVVGHLLRAASYSMLLTPSLGGHHRPKVVLFTNPLSVISYFEPGFRK